MEDREYHEMFLVEESHWWFVSRRRFVSTILDAYIRRISGRRIMRIADIGAGTGGMVQYLSRCGSVVGIEPHELGRKLARKRHITLRPGTAGHTGLPDERFDIVCFFDVLYHRGLDDRRALVEAYRILRPGGIVLITDSALPFLSGPHDRAVEARERYVLGAFAIRVREAGFVILTQTYTFFLIFPLIAAKRIFDRFFRPKDAVSDVGQVSPLVNRALVWINRIESLSLPYIRLPWGSSLLLVARKGDA